MRLDNLIYDPAGTNNGLDATIVKGSFVFITGNVGSAQGEGVSIDTPAGTIGIRGTSGGVVQDPQSGAWIFTLFRDPNGHLSHFTVTNPAGEQLLDQEFQTTEVAGLHIAPAQTIVLSPAQASALFADALHMLQQQFPDLQQHSELENIIPAAGEEQQYAVDPGQLLATPASLSALYGLEALGTALADLLGNDTEHQWGGAPPPIDGGPPTFLPVNENTFSLPPQTNTVTEDANPDSTDGDVLASNSLVVTAVDGITVEPGGADVVGVYGTLHLNVNGTYTYTLDNADPDVQALGAGQTAKDVFSYTASDGHGHVATATLTITVTGTNDAPVAAADVNTVPEDSGSVSGNVLANDSDVDKSDVLALSAVDGSADNVGTAIEGIYGTLQLNANGSYSYTPDDSKTAVQALGAGETATDEFSYTVSDGHGGSANATLTITVTGTNDPPVANPDEATTAEDTPVTIAVLGNDTDVDGDPLTVSSASALHGTVVINDNGTLTYTPAANYNGPDTISYTANDGTVDSNVATVAVTVTPVNDPPVAVNDDPVTTAEDTAVTVTVLGNDTDVDGDPLTVSSASALHGTVIINDNGTLTYTPAANYNGPDTISYTANDGTVDSNVATVAVTVTPVNDPPVAVDDSVTTAEDTPILVSMLANDTDTENDPLTAVIVSGPTHGTLTVNADGGYVYTPNADYNGSDSFTYKANDGAADSNVATVSITVTAVNDAPVAHNDSLSGAEDTTFQIAAASLLGNDTDADHDALTIASVGPAAHGTVTLNQDGSVSYAPGSNYNGPDSFTYTVSDGHGGTSSAQVSLTVTPVNDPPVANNDSYHVVQGNTLTVNAVSGVLANDTDVDGDKLTVAVSTGPAHGQLTLNTDGSFSYTPTATYDGPDSFKYTVSDGHGGTAEGQVTIGIDDSVPRAIGESVTVADTAHKTIDLVIILDRSGSMNDPSGVPGVSTRLELARAAIAALFESYQSVADLHIQIVDFSDSAASSGWLASPEDANAYLAGLTAGGGTNYTAAIDTAMTAYAGAPAAAKTEVYFLSDGVPTAGEGLSADKTAQWEGFLSGNHVDKALAIGIGTGIDAGDPDLAAVAYPNGDPHNPIIVTQPAQLIPTLVATIANPVSCNVIANDDFGADGKGNVGGGGLLSIKIDGVTYSFDGTKIVNDANATVIAGAALVEPTLLGGLLEFHFDSGNYTYTPPDVTATKSENFAYTIVDGDGDQATATLHVDVTNSGLSVADPSVIFGKDPAGATNESLAGGTRDDIMSGGAGDDTVSGGDGNDHIQGGAGNDSLLGGAGADILIGGDGTDSLVGGDGDDRIVVGTGDNADGGAGNDIILLTDNSNFGSVHGGGTDAVDL